MPPADLEEEETPVHVLWHCEGLVTTRFLMLGTENPRAHREEQISRTLSFIKKTKLEGTF